MKYGDLEVTIYDFEHEGDTLSSHAHDPKTTHITICARGEVKVVTPEWEKRMKEGNIIEFHPYQRHAIVALTDGCRIINVPIYYTDNKSN
jgi:quercetin dioxygenase-like cupin family protein